MRIDADKYYRTFLYPLNEGKEIFIDESKPLFYRKNQTPMDPQVGIQKNF